MARYQTLQTEGGNFFCYDNYTNQRVPLSKCSRRERKRLGILNMTEKALDYAWECRNGQVYCMNTHGLPGNQSDQWDIVNNEANCAGTYKPQCSSPGSMVTTGNRTSGPTLIGAPYLSAIKSQGELLGLTPRTINRVKKVASMRTTMYAFLRNRGIRVNNPNDIYEVSLLYANNNPLVSKYFNANDIALTLGAIKPGIQRFDASGLFDGIYSFFENIVNSVNSAENEKYLAQFVTDRVEYMRVDFAEINKVLQAEGPQAALAKLQQYKNTSWAELKAFLVHWCELKNIPYPEQVKQLDAAQVDLENSIKDLMNPNRGTGSGAPGGGAPGPGYFPQGNGSGFDIGKNLPLILIGVVVLFLLMRK